jgi:tetratricopeptide (TPR) repeat protein
MASDLLLNRPKIRTLVLGAGGTPQVSGVGATHISVIESDLPKNPEDQVLYLQQQGLLAWESADFSMAEELFRKSLVAVRTAGMSKSWQALSATYLAELYDETYRVSEARQLYRTAVEWLDLSECKTAGEIELRYKCQNNLACLLKANENYMESEAHFVKAINVLEADLPDSYAHRFVLYNNLGALYHAAAYFEAALKMHGRALEFAEKVRPLPQVDLIKLHRNMALAALFAKQTDLALEHLEAAQKAAEKCPDFASEGLVELLITEASTRFTTNDLVGAEAFCIRAISLAQLGPKRGNGLLPLLYSNLGCVYAKAGHFEQSREMLEDAHLMRLANLSTTDEELRASHHNLALLAGQLGDSESAQRHQLQVEHLNARLHQHASNRSTQSVADNLIFHAPAAFEPTVAQPLGVRPIGLAL